MNKVVFIFISTVLISCASNSKVATWVPPTVSLAQQTLEIIFTREGPKSYWKKNQETLYLYPTIDYFDKIEPLFYGMWLPDLDTTSKVVPIATVIPDSLRYMYDYYPYTVLDSLVVRDEPVIMYSPLMPTTTKGEYVMETVSFNNEYNNSRLYAIYLNYYKIDGNTCTPLRYEEYEMGAYGLEGIRSNLEQMKMGNRPKKKH
jgi:hypothetical protein